MSNLRLYNLKHIFSKQRTKEQTLKYLLNSTNGQSFMIGANLLYNNAHQFTEAEIEHYIILAGLRDYEEFKATGKTTLDLDLCPCSESDVLENRLLFILNNQVFFQYEEEAKCA